MKKNNYSKSDARAKVGDIIMIDAFEPDTNGLLPKTEMSLVGKTGVVKSIDDTGALHGTWGSISVLPVDEYHIVKES